MSKSLETRAQQRQLVRSVFHGEAEAFVPDLLNQRLANPKNMHQTKCCKMETFSWHPFVIRMMPFVPLLLCSQDDEEFEQMF